MSARHDARDTTFAPAIARARQAAVTPAQAGRGQPRIAYVIGTFPSLTTTFIDRELLALRREGLVPLVIGIRRPPPVAATAEILALAAEARYLLPAAWPSLLTDHLAFAVRQPRAYWGTLVYLLSRPHPSVRARLKTLLHFAEGVRAAALLRPHAVRHVHAHFADRAAVVALVASRMLGIPYSLTAHANDIYVAPVLLTEKLADAKFVVTCTAYNQAYLQRLSRRDVHLVYHGLDFSSLAAQAGPARETDEPLILSVGQLKEKKGFQFLIEASRLLKAQGLSFRCEIVGEGPDRAALEAQIAGHGLQDTVILHGARPNSDVMALYPRARVFVLPSVPSANGDRDGLPNVLLEAMAHGVPVISTRTSGIPEAVQDGQTGLLVEPGDAPALAAAIQQLWHDPALRQSLGARGRAFVQEHFDVHANTRQLAGLLTAEAA